MKVSLQVTRGAAGPALSQSLGNGAGFLESSLGCVQPFGLSFFGIPCLCGCHWGYSACHVAFH